MKLFKFSKLLKGQVVLRLIEDEMSADKYVRANDIYVEKNALNDEYTHSYFARVLDVCENDCGIKPNDVVYLKNVYAREVYKDEQRVPFMISSLINCIAKINDFDASKIFQK